jgi:ATP-dependent Clp protease ATP-binding subunit ClpC
MSEYHEHHTVSRLFGAPPGYIGYEKGGQLTEAVRRRPYRVVLFDEVEKAHPEVLHALLQILDDGRLTDGQGRTVDFRNTVVIMTSNVGTRHIGQGAVIGFGKSDDEQAEEESRRKIQKTLKEIFRPEFINRVDEIIVFNQLTPEDVEEIVDIQMEEIAERLAEQGLEVELTQEARAWLAREGFDPQFGARPLRRALQRHVESPLSIQLLRSDFKSGDRVLVDIGEEGLEFTRLERLDTGQQSETVSVVKSSV